MKFKTESKINSFSCFFAVESTPPRYDSQTVLHGEVRQGSLVTKFDIFGTIENGKMRKVRTKMLLCTIIEF